MVAYLISESFTRSYGISLYMVLIEMIDVFHDNDSKKKVLSEASPCFHRAVCIMSDGTSRDQVFQSQLDHITFVDIDCEIIYAVILHLPLIQEGQLSVTDKNICTKYWLTTQRSKPVHEKVH